MEGDVSNKTIVVLVILTVIISILSTFVVMGEVSNLELQSARQSSKVSSNSGKVTFAISEPVEPLPPMSATGQVVFRIV
ncbi:hypothetical protein JW756_06410 [Candidatus Woesearchaeota archaeon]|nr:hypothetical protein [Candidatus Woesearchaeota archaeon]